MEKIIHLCWFSRDPYPVEIKICLDTWKKILPDYQVRLWNYDEARNIGCDYINEALEHRKWAFASDAVRFYAVYSEGGLYMDSDIYLLKRFDHIIPDKGCATMYEYPTESYRKNIPGKVGVQLQSAFFIGEKGNQFCKDVFDEYVRRHFVKDNGEFDLTISPVIMAEVAYRHGMKDSMETQILDGLTIYPASWLAYRKGCERTDETFGVHTIYGNWRKHKLGRRIERGLKHCFLWVRYYAGKVFQ